MLKLSGLQHFVAVCSTRNLTTAAQMLGVSQPALTQAIGKLERQLGVALFDRSTRPLSITACGETLLDYARTMERNSDDLVARLEAIKSGSGGVVRVGCGPDWIHEILPRAIARLQAAHPKIRISLTVALNDQLRARLDAGELDMFFASISDVYFGSAYETRIMLRERMEVIAHIDHPIHEGAPKTLEELAKQTWVLTGDETFGRQLVRHVFERANIQLPPPAVETNSVRALIHIVRRSPHLGFLSRTHINAYPDIDAVETVTEMPLREGGVTWRRDAPLLPAAEALLANVEYAIRHHEEPIATDQGAPTTLEGSPAGGSG
ncbi:MAG: LysR family transcriptional regulator [Rhodobiaceae bacterium]|nr:LysR family transcriptional regulator [Rhodobiaceae bacterium]